MPYKSIDELPKNVRNVLPIHAQIIYKEAFNNAWIEYKDPEKRRGHEGHEETAHQVAWAAVKHTYKKGEDKKWHKKS